MLVVRARLETRRRKVFWGDLEIDELNTADDLHSLAVNTIATFTTVNCEHKEGVPHGAELPIDARIKGHRSGVQTGIWKFGRRKRLSTGVYTYKVEKIQ
jgi:hypothetical protein